MRAFTDVFIKHPVLAIVVNLIIVLVGVRALTQLPVQQFPDVESSSVIITTVSSAWCPPSAASITSSPRAARA
jgi:multidrug efflux pump